MVETITLQNRKRMINIASLMLLVMSFLFIFVMPVAFAENDNSLQIEQIKEMTTGPLKIITDTLNIQNAEGGVGTSGFGSFFTKVTSEDSPAVTIMNGFKAIGGAFAFIIAISHLMQALERGQDMMEAVFKVLFELMIVFLFIVNSDDIIKGLSHLGTIIVSTTASHFNGTLNNNVMSDEDCEKMLKTLTGHTTGGFWWQIRADIALFIPRALSFFVIIGTKFAILSLLFELAIRQALTPLFIADIYQEGLRSPGAKHLKQYLAVYVKMAICVIVCIMAQFIIKTQDPTNGMMMLIENIAINFTCIAVMMKSNEYVSNFV